MSFCEYCGTISAKLFSSFKQDQGYYDHQPTFTALRESAIREGCPGCRLFLYAVEGRLGLENPGRHRDKVDRKWNEDDRVRLGSTKFGYQDVRIGLKIAGRFRGKPVIPEWKDFPVLAAGRHDKSAHLAFEARLINQWSKICLKTHERCSQTQPNSSFLPRRLIDVGTASSPTLRLVTTSGFPPESDRRYLALSHCWGTSMPPLARTITNSFDDHSTSISFSSLPLTFQEFIQISRRLGVRHVWIDSLCIIQDSRSDWEHQAAQMADIYANAFLTVAASSSADGSEGCHHHVDDESDPDSDSEAQLRSFGPVDIDCPSLCAESDPKAKPITFRLWTRDTFPASRALASDPLLGRGWTLQERELSKRVVHYSRDTIRWECGEVRGTLEFPWSDAECFDRDERFFYRRRDTGGVSGLPGMPLRNINTGVWKPKSVKTQGRVAWLNIVARYTGRKLTKQEDVLPAFSGIAKKVAEQTGDEYLAGLWRGYLGHCLLWASKWHAPRGLDTHSRPELSGAGGYLAPSWSWASVKGPVEYLSFVNGAWHSFNASLEPEYVPRLLEVSLEPEYYADPFGKLKEGGWIKVEGKLGFAVTFQERYARLERGSAVSYTPGCRERMNLMSVMSRESPQSRKVGEIRYDVPLCEECAPVGMPRFVALLCCVNSDRSADGRVRTAAVALEPDSGGNGAWRRVGVAWGIDSGFWETVSTLAVTMI
ncbi:pantothenate transporter [Cladorrhinum sp. PSN332]|nr:pantothenate transporter [Cladorrhinum sp. PSN332]